MDALPRDLPQNPDILAISDSRETELLTLPIDEGRTKNLIGGSNIVQLIYFGGDGNGVFKPGRGEDTLWEFPESHRLLYKRERAAYLVSKALHPGLVPPTIIRTINGAEGSIQDFIPDPKRTLRETGDGEKEAVRGQLFEIAIFDYVVWNKDRKPENLFIKDRRVIAIDNGVSFNEWLRGWIPENLSKMVAGRLIPTTLAKQYDSFLTSDEKQNRLREALEELVPGKTIDAMFARINQANKFLARGKISWDDMNDFTYHPGSTESIWPKY
ncbi:MAG: hypothetical protein HYV90_02445 [Candidatus Woesebacteria bacterium]|nr:MAG: hypothetical protein HYV90_02445 [Candidatus Woesebacteria bacterium]